jgi:D-alanyl-D-alanine carboxypeptidase (penicillin-binding protein 5/6)
MMQRAVLAIVLVMMIVITALTIFFVSSVLPSMQSIAQLVAPTPTRVPTPTPSPAPTPLSPTPTPTPAPFISGSAAYLIDADTGRVLYNMNSFQQLPIASTTKMMTAIVAIENANLEQGVTVEQSDLDAVPPNASSAGLVAGDYFRLHTLLYGLMLPSGTDASIVIARAVAGSRENFVAMMNRKAQELRLTHTHFSSPHGFGGGNHYSSADDLVTLANYAMRNPLFAQLVGRRTYDVRPTLYTHAYQWVNTNNLLASYQGADGVKTGWTNDAGVCLVFSARRNGHHLIGAELHASSYDAVFADGAKLLDLGFSKD